MNARIHNGRYCRCPKPRGFSLVELLVAIAIVAILAMIGIQIIHHIHVTAERTECASNMRQVWQGTLLYVNDHDGELPKDKGNGDMGPWKINGQRTVGAVGWVANELKDYVPDSTWYCPDPKVVEYSETPGNNFGRVWRKPNNKSASPYDPKSLSYLNQWEQLPDIYAFMCNPGGKGMGYPHNEKPNLLMMDGHIEIMDFN